MKISVQVAVITDLLQRLRFWDKSREHLDIQDHHVCTVLLSIVSVKQTWNNMEM